MSTAERLQSSQALDSLRADLVGARETDGTRVVVSNGTCCQAYGSERVIGAFETELAERSLVDTVQLKSTGCHGFCAIEPIVVIEPQGVLYQRVSFEDVPEIVDKTIGQGEVIERLLHVDKATGERTVYEKDVPFYRKQQRVMFEQARSIEPTSIEDYIAAGGYNALAKAISSMTPDEVIDEVKRSGLRGRGGAGFPTGRKWESCRQAEGEQRYVICNADEGDPGAYMDRGLLEGNPHSILEGMIIAAYGIGSRQGYIYIRYEYPLALHHLDIALDQARAYGLLGDDILGSGFSFDIGIRRGGGAFVCGESSALMQSLEGDVGEPRAKYVRSVERGLWEQPTTLNNVETWANVPLIINKGWEWYASIGTEGSKGTKIFSLVGKVNNTGLVEVPMGITLREIIFDIGGGIPEDRQFKAVQTGGPSGGCIPASLLDLPVDFDELAQAGSMMGSGGMIVMDDRTCMVDVARYFLGFLREESCGKCTPCREGISRSLEILNRICEGEGRPGDIDLLEEVAELLSGFSLCGLGKSAANPLLSTIQHFREEYEAHINDRRCPGGVCKALITYTVNADNCTGCGACVRQCPQNAITGEKKEAHLISQDLCIRCGICLDVCKFDAVLVE